MWVSDAQKDYLRIISVSIPVSCLEFLYPPTATTPHSELQALQYTADL